jgi:branched-chain amino acid transport system ATP-binding protein
MMALLEVETLSKHFYEFPALEKVSIEVREGELLGIIGPNGSGKTTLFNCISGTLPPTSGRVRLNGEDITGMSADRIFQRGLARTFQLIQVFPEMTVLENMLMAVQERDGTMLGRVLTREPASVKARAHELLDDLGIDFLHENLASNLSYGQQKLLDFGMALMSKPDVILLDEPLAGVNPTMIQSLLGHIKELNAKGNTFVVIEHNMEAVMSLCERIIVLSQGQQIAEGMPDEVAHNPLVLDAYFGR